MNIRPLYDRIVVKRLEDQTENKIGGLFIPDSAKEKPQEGEVVAVGKGKRLEDGKVVPLDVEKGNRILFGKYSGSEIRIDGRRFQESYQSSLGASFFERRHFQWQQNKLFIAKIPVRRSCAASTSWLMR
jgi:chaperonin GroES